MKLSKGDKYLLAGVVSFALALPFQFLASGFWMSNETARDGLLGLGSKLVFLLGAPLTLLPDLINLPHSSREQLVFINILFSIQWIIWSQLIVFLYSKFSTPHA